MSCSVPVAPFLILKQPVQCTPPSQLRQFSVIPCNALSSSKKYNTVNDTRHEDEQSEVYDVRLEGLDERKTPRL